MTRMKWIVVALLACACSKTAPAPKLIPKQQPKVFVDPDVTPIPVPSPVPSPVPNSSPVSSPAPICSLSLDLVPTLIVGQPATLRGSACGAYVEVTVDEWPIGTAQVSNGRWELSYSFTASGDNRSLVVNEFDSSWKFLLAIERAIDVEVPPQTSYSKVRYHGLDLSAKAKLEHTSAVELLGDALDESQGLELYERGILPQAESKDLFLGAVTRGVVPRYGNAQCAVTTASVLESAFKLAGLIKQAQYFSKDRRFSLEDFLSCTDRVETLLAKLGWNYFLKKAYIAPKGAIALAVGRWIFCAVSQHSGHIYTILEDRGEDRDLIADNSGYGREYSSDTEGFWLPNGVYPMERK